MAKIILNILLLPFVLIFILIGAIKGALGAKNIKYIPLVINKLAEGRAPPTAIAELKFPQVLAYATEEGVITELGRDLFKFLIVISGKSYSVEVSRAPDGSNCAIFRSSFFENSINPSDTREHKKIADTFMSKQKTVGNQDLSLEIEDKNISQIIGALDEAYMKHSKHCSW